MKCGHQTRQLNSATVANGKVYLPYSIGGVIICADLKGKELWMTATSEFNLKIHGTMNSGGLFEYCTFTELAVTEKLVFVGCQDGKLYAFDTKTGKKQWDFATKSPILTCSPSVAGSLVYFGSTDKNRYAVDMQGTEAWKFALGGAINSSPLPSDGVVYVGCDDGKIYAIE